MTEVGWEKTWSTRDLAGGFNGLRPDRPRKNSVGIMRKLFQNRVCFEVDCKTMGEIKPGYRKGLDQVARISHHEWQAEFKG